jgi:hypothetical protein
MLAFADVVHLLTHELANLCAWSLAFPLIFAGPFESFLFGHI